MTALIMKMPDGVWKGSVTFGVQILVNTKVTHIKAVDSQSPLSVTALYLSD
jgi:hypothetical protein